MRNQCLGLIGGLGIGATMHYYRDLTMSSRASGQPLNLLIAHANLTQVFAYVRARDKKGLAHYLNEFICSMSAAGATIAAISAITPHLALDELHAICPLPIIGVFEPLKQAIAERGIRRVTVFGTGFVMGSGLFGRLPIVEIVMPQAQEVEIIDAIYTQLTVDGEAGDDHHTMLTMLAHAILTRERIDVIVLAGTEFSLVFKEANTDFPALDCARLHLSSIKQAIGIEKSARAEVKF